MTIIINMAFVFHKSFVHFEYILLEKSYFSVMSLQPTMTQILEFCISSAVSVNIHYALDGTSVTVRKLCFLVNYTISLYGR